MGATGRLIIRMGRAHTMRSARTRAPSLVLHSLPRARVLKRTRAAPELNRWAALRIRNAGPREYAGYAKLGFRAFMAAGVLVASHPCWAQVADSTPVQPEALV